MIDSGYDPYAGYEAYGNYGGNYQTNFVFKKRFQPIDWKKVASVDIDSISKNLDFTALQENVANITFCNIESELDVQSIDPNYIKLFKLAQLTIEYLLHSQDYLAAHVTTLDGKIKETEKELTTKKKNLERTKKDLDESKKECRRRKKLLQAQQQLLQTGPNSFHKCPHCSKAFMNWSFLFSHLQRRHPDQLTASQYQQYLNVPQGGAVPFQGYQSMPVQTQPQPQPSASQDEANLILRQEIAELKEKLRQNEEQWHRERQQTPVHADRLVHCCGSTLPFNYNCSNFSAWGPAGDYEQLLKKQKQREKELEQMQRQQEKQEKKHQDELLQVQEMMWKEMRELEVKNKAALEQMEAMQRKMKNRSNLGSMEDAEIQHEKEQLRKQREELALLKEEALASLQKKKAAKRLDANEADWKKAVTKAEKDKVSPQKANKLQKPADSESEESSDEEDEEDSDQHQLQQEYEQTVAMQEVFHPFSSLASTKSSLSRKVQVHPTATGPTHIKASMGPPSDDESEMIDNSTAGPSTAKTLGSESLSMAVTRHRRLEEAVKKNPNLLKEIRKGVASQLDDQLEQRGIPMNSPGLSDEVFAHRNSILQQERKAKAAKYSNFWEFRQQYHAETEQFAKKKLLELNNSEHGTKRMSRDTTGASPNSTSILRRPVSLPPQASTPQPSAPIPKAPRPRSLSPPTSSAGMVPVPAPRTTSPRGPQAGLPKGNMPEVKRSYGEQTNVSSDWGEEQDSEESESYDEEETETAEPEIRPQAKKTTTAHVTAPKVTSPQHQRPPQQQAGRSTKSPRQARPSESTEEEDSEESETDEDSVDDTNDISEMILDPEQPTPRSKKTTTASPSVNEKRKNIQALLAARSSKKPVGGVDVSPQTTLQRQRKDSDESIASVSDIEEANNPNAAPTPVRRPGSAMRSSTATDASNTYGSSAWGSGSKAEALDSTIYEDFDDILYDFSPLLTSSRKPPAGPKHKLTPQK